MKKTVILFVIFCTVLYSCIIESGGTANFKIINQTSHDIKIRITNYEYNSTVPIDTIFFLPQNQQIERYFEKGGEGSEPFGWRIDNTAFIIFNDSDTLFYTWQDNSPRNILHKENYQKKIEEKSKRWTNYYYTYTFTEADYQNAVKGKK